MPKGCRIVDEFNIVRTVADFTIAVGGIANSVQRALVVKEGFAREFWPPNLPVDNPIVLSTTAATSFDTTNIPDGSAIAFCDYDARTGRLILSTPEGDPLIIQALNPAPRAKGLYLLRADVISGTIQGDPTGVWIDVLDKETIGVFNFFVENDTGVAGQVLGEMDFSIAEDDGAGSPAVGTTVTKRISFIAESVGINLSMTTVPWSLSDLLIQEDADVEVLTTSQLANHSADVIGNEHSIERFREVYAQIWDNSITVQVDVISGVLLGDPTGVPLQTNIPHRWYIEATADGEDFTTVIDLTIVDSASSVTKRITMHVSRTDEDTDPGSDLSTDFTQFDRLEDIAEEPIFHAEVQISFLDTGRVTALEGGSSATNFPQSWNLLSPATPDPQNFEIRLVVTSGDAPTTGVVNIWQNLSSTRTWILAADSLPAPDLNILEGDYNIEVREVGRPSTVLVKQLIMFVQAEAIEFLP